MSNVNFSTDEIKQLSGYFKHYPEKRSFQKAGKIQQTYILVFQGAGIGIAKP